MIKVNYKNQKFDLKRPICADEIKECDVLVCHYPKHCEIKYANNNNNGNNNSVLDLET